MLQRDESMPFTVLRSDNYSCDIRCLLVYQGSFGRIASLLEVDIPMEHVHNSIISINLMPILISHKPTTH